MASGRQRAPASCVRELISSLRYALRRWYSTVAVVTNSVSAISRFGRPSAASSAIRRSLGVSAPAPVVSRRRGRAPVARSSASAASSTARPPQRCARSIARRSASRASSTSPARAQRRAEREVRPRGLQQAPASRPAPPPPRAAGRSPRRRAPRPSARCRARAARRRAARGRALRAPGLGLPGPAEPISTCASRERHASTPGLTWSMSSARRPDSRSSSAASSSLPGRAAAGRAPQHPQVHVDVRDRGRRPS